MNARKSGFPEDRTERERRKNLDDHEVDDLELAGGVEGGMQAGSAGGPGEKDVGPSRKSDTRKSSGRPDDRR